MIFSLLRKLACFQNENDVGMLLNDSLNMIHKNDSVRFRPLKVEKIQKF